MQGRGHRHRSLLRVYPEVLQWERILPGYRHGLSMSFRPYTNGSQRDADLVRDSTGRLGGRGRPWRTGRNLTSLVVPAPALAFAFLGWGEGG